MANNTFPRDQVRGGGDAQLRAPETGDLWFDPWLTSHHPAVETLVASVMSHYEEVVFPKRLRAPSKREKDALAAAAQTIAANLALASLVSPAAPSVAISRQAARQKRSRYDSPGISTVHTVLDQLSKTYEGGGALSVRVSRRRGIASTITVRPALVSAFACLSERDFTHLPGGEVIWLRWKTRGHFGRINAGVPIDYPETAETTRMREELRLVNAQLAACKLTARGAIASGTQGASVLRRFFVTSDPSRFNFDLGGRLYGGWWQTLPRGDRDGLRIDGEEVVDLDFSNMFLRLAYLHAGKEAPEGDLYGGVRGLAEPRWREGVKRITASLLCRESALQRLPKGMEGMLPSGMTGKAVRDALIERHPALRSSFESGVGLRLMFLESEILVGALLRLADQGVTALPMHDGLMVARSAENVARAAMAEGCLAVLGRELPIVAK